MTILTTGTLSGLGKYIHENLGGISLSRDTFSEVREKTRDSGVDTIIHSAFNSQKKVDSGSLYQYLQDNIMLTEELVKIPHKKFIFLSTVDIYPKDGRKHTEEEIIDTDSVNGIYGITKLMSESIVRNRCSNYLILRASALLGKYMRGNSLLRILDDKDCVLSLSGDSEFNYILHSDIVEFIRFSMESDLKGIYNTVSSDNISLSEVANIAGVKVEFGDYIYNAGGLDNSNISSLFPGFRKTSKEVVKEFIEMRNG